MKFEWDEEKCQANIDKHGLSFADAWIVFANETLTFPDDRENYGGKRFITLGNLVGRIVVVVHAQREEFTRIISMRKANARERKIYQERLGQN